MWIDYNWNLFSNHTFFKNIFFIIFGKDRFNWPCHSIFPALCKFEFLTKSPRFHIFQGFELSRTYRVLVENNFFEKNLLN